MGSGSGHTSACISRQLAGISQRPRNIENTHTVLVQLNESSGMEYQFREIQSGAIKRFHYLGMKFDMDQFLVAPIPQENILSARENHKAKLSVAFHSVQSVTDSRLTGHHGGLGPSG